MATYIYETIPSGPNEKPKRYEIKQSMKDTPLANPRKRERRSAGSCLAGSE